MRFSFHRRRAYTLIEVLVVVAIIAILIALLVPAVQKVRHVTARTQSTNNLKQCALASHAYHDAWKYLPYNGVENATNTDNTSGSWAYQILPYVDQQAMYDSQPADTSMAIPVPALLCAIRGRPGYYAGFTSAGSSGSSVSGTIVLTPIPISPPNSPTVATPFTANPTFTYAFSGPYEWFITVTGPCTISMANMTQTYPGQPPVPVNPGTWSVPAGSTITYAVVGNATPPWQGDFIITATGAPSAVSSAGPATDFGINVFLNDTNGGINSPNVNRNLETISDGASNTILLGHAYVQPSVYSSTTPAPSALQPIFIAGSWATGRNSLGNTATTWLPDGTATTANQWGSPMVEGGLMAMCDGTVRIFPYATLLTDFLLPDDGSTVELP